MRKLFLIIAVTLVTLNALAAWFWPSAWWMAAIYGPFIAVGVYDMIQTKHAIRRNFPVIGHGRYLMEMIRPEINQYFVESNWDGMPFNRERRSVVYQIGRAHV